MNEFIEKYRLYIGVVLVLVILAGGLVLLWQKKQQAKPELNNGEVTIDIEGAVARPGVYKLESGAIIEDAIAKAGGLTDQCDTQKLAANINRAEKLEDAQKIMIPTKAQTTAVANTQQSADNMQQVTVNNQQGMININTATAQQLDTLPGIGPAYAQRIIDYRTQNGGFETIEEIMEVKGIGEGTFEKIKNQITI